VKLGNPRNIRKAGELGRQVLVNAADQFAKDILPAVNAIRGAGTTSLGGIAQALNKQGIRTARGKCWHGVVGRKPARAREGARRGAKIGGSYRREFSAITPGTAARVAAPPHTGCHPATSRFRPPQSQRRTSFPIVPSRHFYQSVRSTRRMKNRSRAAISSHRPALAIEPAWSPWSTADVARGVLPPVRHHKPGVSCFRLPNSCFCMPEALRYLGSRAHLNRTTEIVIGIR
jgi:hypothetical protein